MIPDCKPTLHTLNEIDEALIKYAVIASRYGDSWLFSRHKCRSTWEIPGGHREPGETPLQTAHRELAEETGATSAEIHAVGVYKLNDFGLLCYANVEALGPVPSDSEIAEVQAFRSIPAELTYGEIHAQLFRWVLQWLQERD